MLDETVDSLKIIAHENLIGEKVLVSKALLAALLLESGNVRLKEQVISDSSILDESSNPLDLQKFNR